MQAQKDAGLLSKGGGEKGVGRKGKQCGLGENPHSPITLEQAGIDKNLADRARKYAAVPAGFPPLSEIVVAVS